MRAMAFTDRSRPVLDPVELPDPSPGPGKVLIRIAACGVCRTDLHLVDGDLPDPKIPVVPGHEIVGTVEKLGSGVDGLAEGDRVGVPWLGGSCGGCRHCREGRENLCPDAQYTGFHMDGGYADYTVADARYTFHLPDGYSDVEAAPLLCAGLIGYRSYRMALESYGEVRRLGLYGFGAAAHIIAQVAAHHGREVYAFTRDGDDNGQRFAMDRGAAWAGPSGADPGVVLDGEERTVRSVANLTRRDALEFLELAPQVPVKTRVTSYPMADANKALDDLRHGRFEGAAVLANNG
jgi:propanol-preferring alcohol dehydrogenase